MAESSEKDRHCAKAVTDEPQEEFVEPKARPSVPKDQTSETTPEE